MTVRDTPSPEPVLRLLEESGLPEEPLLLDAVRHIDALGEGPAPDASAELGQLMADGGRAPRSRRNKRRITFIGGALAVSMGAGMSGVAAGTLHLPSGLGDAVDSIVHFTARDSADHAERPAHPPADASKIRVPSGHGAAGAAAEHGTAGPPGDKPLGAPVGSEPAPSTSGAPWGAGASFGPGVLPASGEQASSAVSGAFAVSPAISPVAPRVHGPAGAVPPLPAPPMQSARDAGIATAPAGPPAPVVDSAPKKAGDNAGAGRDTAGPVKAAEDTTGPTTKGQDDTRQDRKVRAQRLGAGPAADEVQALPAPRHPGVSWLRAPAGPSNPFLDDAPTAWGSDRVGLFLAETFVDPAAVPSEEHPAPDSWTDDVAPGEVTVPEVPEVPEVPDTPAAGVVAEEPGAPVASLTEPGNGLPARR